jgi:hypothetical protein
MRKAFTTQNNDMGKHYILTGSQKVEELNLDDMDESQDYRWLEKSRRLQARRWRKIKHQLA